MSGKATAAYYRAWRAAHPEYRERQRILRAERRRLHGRGNRAAEYAKRVKAIPPMPVPFSGHPIFDAARAIVGPARSGLTVWLDPLHEELLEVAVVALVEGSDPVAAVRKFRAAENGWRRLTAPLVREIAA